MCKVNSIEFQFKSFFKFEYFFAIFCENKYWYTISRFCEVICYSSCLLFSVTFVVISPSFQREVRNDYDDSRKWSNAEWFHPVASRRMFSYTRRRLGGQPIGVKAIADAKIE